ncbi:PREDICTED: fibrillin-1-like [Branchiostoma belcheri]|uniref:chitinase n=1 Tax=Branchiostoma belcheri TaxID=7741 RepID=A0A6P4YQG4_BRABE|nr:PREDICTED: fibrillin-1-like [Branchiostoma belcheri]
MRAAMAMWTVLLLLVVNTGSVTAGRYGGYDYWVNHNLLSYWDAMNSCGGGHLVDFSKGTSDGSFNWDIQSYLARNVLGNYWHLFWAGLREYNGMWKWWPGGRPATHIPWHGGQPNNGNQNCGLWKWNVVYRVWAFDDEYCTTVFKSICQKDVNECSSNNGGCAHNCVNTDGSYHCTCRTGYELSGSRTCVDANECSGNNGGCNHGCTNTVGSYRCTCRTGYRLAGPWTCVDINECSSNNGGCAHDCVNTDGSFHCTCRDGYQLSESRNCVDVDECLANGGRGPCDHICTDELGSYRCSCRDGYELGSDGFSCVAPCSEDFTPPQHGSVTCGDVSTGGRFCTVACNARHEFACRPADGYSCDTDGNWNLLGRSTCDADELPGDALWPDCSRMHLAWMPQMANADYYYDGDCQNNVAEIIQMFDRLFNTLGGAASSGSGTSNIENINVACGETTRSSGNTNTSEGRLEQLIAKLCENQPDGSLQPHPYDCSMYIQCHQAGHDAVFDCPPGTRWSQELQTCARADLVTCD